MVVGCKVRGKRVSYTDGDKSGEVEMATLIKGLRLSDIASMPQDERDRQINELFQAALNPTEEQIQKRWQELDKQIQGFEQKYHLSSLNMEKQVKSGTFPETNDVCSWLMLLRKKSRFEQRHPKTSAY